MNNFNNIDFIINDIFLNINDFYKEETKGFQFGTGAGGSTNVGESALKPKGSTTIGLTNKGSEKEQNTKATIGNGSIIIAGNRYDNNNQPLTPTPLPQGARDSNPLADLNRDKNNSQEITKDMITGALDGSMTIDNRLLLGFINQNVYERDEKGKVKKDADGKSIVMKQRDKDGNLMLDKNGNTINQTTNGYKSVASDVRNFGSNSYKALDQTAFALLRSGNVNRIGYYGNRAFSEEIVDGKSHEKAAEAYGNYVGSPLVGGAIRLLGETGQFFMYTGQDVYSRIVKGKAGSYQPYKISSKNGGIIDSYNDIMNVVRGANGDYKHQPSQGVVDKYNNQDYKKYINNGKKW